MTTALKELYAFLDVWQVDDDGKVTDRFKQQHPSLSIIAETAAGPIPIADTLDPTSPNYMHWYDPDVATDDAASRRLHRGSDRLPGERRHAALPALRLARRAQEQHRRAVPAVGRQRRRGRSSRRPTSPTGRW